jgi:hypothetical protein
MKSHVAKSGLMQTRRPGVGRGTAGTAAEMEWMSWLSVRGLVNLLCMTYTEAQHVLAAAPRVCFGQTLNLFMIRV